MLFSGDHWSWLHGVQVKSSVVKERESNVCVWGWVLVMGDRIAQPSPPPQALASALALGERHLRGLYASAPNPALQTV